MIFTGLHRVAWWASARRIDWLCALIYRFLCPYSIEGKFTARSCVKAGQCGCNNRGPLPASSRSR